MKKLENKTIKLEINKQTVEKKYSELIVESLSVMPEGGFKGLDVMEQILKILAKVKASEGVIELEDAEAAKAQEAVAGMGWSVLSEEIVQFIRDVRDMK